MCIRDRSDGDEVNKYGTDPLVADTDGDGLDDGDEITLGTNPLVQDTDGDGIIDSKEKFQQTYTPVSYTHLDVYKRQLKISRPSSWR